jgi:RND family efflux transporter MFP subunit
MPEGLPPAAVFVQLVTQKNTQDVAKVTGSLRPMARAEVAAREAGALLEILVDEGDVVSEGAPLARLDTSRAEALHAEARASLTAASSLVDQREAEWQRAADDLTMKRGLLESKAVSKSDVLDAQQALAVTAAQRKAASDGVAEWKSRVSYIEVQLRDLEIRAPFAGVVVARHVEVGEWLTVGASVVSLVSMTPMEAWLRVPVRFRDGLSKTLENLRVIRSATDETLRPSKVILVPEVESLSQLFTVVATLDNPDGYLAPGESITGEVPVSEIAPHWQFAIDGLVRSALGDFVYIVGDGGTAERVAVTVAFERKGLAFVRVADDVLTKDAQIIVEGNERLQPGQPLIVREREGTMPAEQS